MHGKSFHKDIQWLFLAQMEVYDADLQLAEEILDREEINY